MAPQPAIITHYQQIMRPNYSHNFKKKYFPYKRKLEWWLGFPSAKIALVYLLLFWQAGSTTAIAQNSKFYYTPSAGILADMLGLSPDSIRDSLPVVIVLALIILFIMAFKTFGKRENFLETQVKERTRQINLKNQQIIAQTEELNSEKEKVDKVNSELISMLNRLETTIDKMNLQRTMLEESNRKVMDSIRYAKRIQRALLPQHDSIKSLFPESFVFYQAKDIVSGDFYFSTTKMGKSFLAAVDCTGHGVPGAFMSLIAYNQLTRAINEYGILEPARILHWAEKGLSAMLKQGSESGEANDGMEVSLVSIDTRRKRLEYAGARRPLFRIHNNELIEYRGDPYSIGPVQQMVGQEKRFNNHVVDLEEGDMYYIFSDGYVSQFNSETGKKYMTGRFKELLLRIYTLPVEEQKQILFDEYENWRGESPQVDDLLVMGFRIEPENLQSSIRVAQNMLGMEELQVNKDLLPNQ